MSMLSNKKKNFFKIAKWLFVLLPFVVIIIIIASNRQAYSQDIQIVSPIDGAIFEPGETITVVVQSGTGISFKEVAIFFRGNIRARSITPPIDEEPPFEFTVVLPDKLGPIILEAYGRDQTDKVFETEITLNLETTVTLQEIIPLTHELDFNYYSQKKSLTIRGLYSDGKEINITHFKTGTTYKTLSGTENVVKVSPWGLVTAQGNGQETIIISNSGVTKTIPVIVQASNSRPKLTPIGDLSIEAGTVLDVPLFATDPDEDDIITFRGGYLPAFAQIIDNTERTGTLHIAPAGNDIGTFDGIFISAIDNGVPSLSNTEEITIMVQDTTPPELNLTVSPDTLWPPTHKMVLITPTITVTDNLDPNPTVEMTSITTNEGDETNTYHPDYDTTLGDGNTTNDIQVDENGNIFLRAERSGTGSGRIYTITYTATDFSGNSSSARATVTVPHDQQ